MQNINYASLDPLKHPLLNVNDAALVQPVVVMTQNMILFFEVI